MNIYVQELFKNPWVINKTLYIIDIYNNVRDNINILYHSNGLFKTTVDMVYTNTYCIICYLMDVKCRPQSINWKSNCVLYNHKHNNNTMYFMIEDYKILSNNFNKEDINKTLEDSNNKLENTYVNYGSIYDSLYLMNFYNSTISKINLYKNIELQEIEKSDITFLTIEYSHPSMKNKIFLELDKSYFIVGNELFSPCFVKRLLEYQFSAYVFDNNYKIAIIDIQTNIFVLDFNNYLYLEKDKCIIKKYV